MKKKAKVSFKSIVQIQQAEALLAYLKNRAVWSRLCTRFAWFNVNLGERNGTVALLNSAGEAVVPQFLQRADSSWMVKSVEVVSKGN